MNILYGLCSIIFHTEMLCDVEQSHEAVSLLK